MEMEQGDAQMRALIAIIALAFLSGCQTTKVEIAKPCGVIKDSLKDVQAKTREGDFRISQHYERGRGAGCWS